MVKGPEDQQRQQQGGRSMKAKQSVVTLTMGCVLTLGLASTIYSQAQEYESGTFYSAKDPDLPPWPFNPYPGIEPFKVEPGIFLIDGTMIPDTPKQIESRQFREEAEAWAQMLANNPTLAAQVQAEQQAGRSSVQRTTIFRTKTSLA
jgi:hypothetical protein